MRVVNPLLTMVHFLLAQDPFDRYRSTIRHLEGRRKEITNQTMKWFLILKTVDN
jgi:hypothetical protein